MTLIADKQCRDAIRNGGALCFCLTACLWIAIGGIVWALAT